MPFQKAEEAFEAMRPKGVILSGGPASVLDRDAPLAPATIYDAGVPILGICYGEQAMAAATRRHGRGRTSSRVRPRRGAGHRGVRRCSQGVWRKGERYPVWMSHGDRVTQLPDGFRVLGTSSNAPIAVIADEARRFYATQFHLEVVHTPHGAALLRNFVRRIAGCRGDWTMRAFKRGGDREDPQRRSATARVICGLSGGVDSAVAAVLIHEAIGDAAHLRLRRPRPAAAGRGREGRGAVPGQLQHPAGARGSAKTCSFAPWKASPTRKPSARPSASCSSMCSRRKRSKLGGADFLAQGTLYPDVIESVSFTGGPSVTIKSHHNVGGLPARMNMQLVEPLRELFKDEVRALGRELGLPRGLRRPASLPGAGPCDPLPRRGHAREARHPAPRRRTSTSRRSAAPAFTTTSGRPSRCCCRCAAVGVMGDYRTYDYVVGLRAVTSTDGMTADFYPFDMKFIGQVATRIVNEVKGVNRVVYDVTSKPPGTIEWE